MIALVIMLIVFALGALYLGVVLVKSVTDIEQKPLIFAIAFVIAGLVGLGITYFTINGLPEKGFGEFFGNYTAPLILLGIISFPGFIYFVVSFDRSWKFICASILIGISIGAYLYANNYLALIVTIVAMITGFFGDRFLTKVKNNL